MLAELLDAELGDTLEWLEGLQGQDRQQLSGDYKRIERGKGLADMTISSVRSRGDGSDEQGDDMGASSRGAGSSNGGGGGSSGDGGGGNNEQIGMHGGSGSNGGCSGDGNGGGRRKRKNKNGSRAVQSNNAERAASRARLG